MYLKPTYQEFETLIDSIRLNQSIDLRDAIQPVLFRQFDRFLKGKQTNAQSVLNRINDFSLFDELIKGLMIPQTELFRDPEFWLALKKEVFSQLSTSESVNIWVPCFSSGDELFTLISILEELKLNNRVTITATENHLARMVGPKNGSLRVSKVSASNNNFQKYHGEKINIKQIETLQGFHKFQSDLLNKVKFKRHRLGIDSSFDKFDLILCRNVLLNQNFKLASKSYRTLHDSLSSKGFLILGVREKIQSAYYEGKFDLINESERIYRLK